MGDNSVIISVGSTVVNASIYVANSVISVANIGLSKSFGPEYQCPSVPYYNEWPEVRTLISTIIPLGNINTNEKEVLIKRCEQDNITLRTVEKEIIERMYLREKSWAQKLDDGRTPVLVFCVYASRIGTDIDSALKGVRVSDNPPVMVVLHCKNSSSLRGDLSDDDYLLDQELRDRVAGIAHFAFSDLEGVYSCRQNDDGFRKLRNLITELDMEFELLDLNREVLIKRCKQLDNMGVRTVENEVIKRMHLSEKTWTQELDDGQTPVLVFCVNASQTGTDIESALEGIRDYKRVVIVVLHCKSLSSLRGDLSNDDCLLDKEFELRDRVAGIAHFAFSDMEGFYSCHQNDDGFRKLHNLIAGLDMEFENLNKEDK